MSTLSVILQGKRAGTHTIAPTATVLEAVTLMNEHRIGALVVVRGGNVAGMFTERDVLRRVVTDPRRPQEICVSEVMTDRVITATRQSPVEEAMRLMTQHRIRHLPVCDADGRLAGVVSIGDLNAYNSRQKEEALKDLEGYVYASY